MHRSKTSRARKVGGKSGKKTGLVALAAAAMASPVAGAPAAAQSPSAVSPQPSPPSSTDMEIDQRLGTSLPQALPRTEAIGPPCTPRDRGGAQSSVKDKAETTPLLPQTTGGTLQQTPSREQLQTIILKPQPAAPSTRNKALIYTEPSKPSK